MDLVSPEELEMEGPVYPHAAEYLGSLVANRSASQ
jgi:hypothetical protein